MAKKENIIRYSAKELRNMQKTQDKSDWNKLKNMSEEELEAAIKSDPYSDTDIPVNWEGIIIGMPQPKELMSIRIDRDVLQWFRKKGSGYQTYINNILRSYVSVQEMQSPKPSSRLVVGMMESGFNS